MSNIHVEYTSGIFHKNMKNIYMHYGRVMREVINIVYFFQVNDNTWSPPKRKGTLETPHSMSPISLFRSKIP